MSTALRCLTGLALLWVSAAGWAADIAGSRDLPMLPRFAGSQIVSFKEVAAQERIYPQGPIRRLSGKLRYERQVVAQGQLTALTYEVPRSHSADEVFAAAREALQAQGAELLYWCVGRECGSSSLWANAVFENATLYGSDEQQAYGLLRLAAPQQDSLLALYSITRGSKRAFLHAELLQASAPLGELLPTPATLQRQLKSSGALYLAQLAEPSEAWVALLARSLNQDSTMRVSLSGAQAAAWRDALIEQRVRAARLELGEPTVNGLRIEVLR
jgi:hypothetical protein